MDIFEFAIKMELDGEKFYLDLAEESKNNSLSKVFLSLAKDEANHAKIIQDKQAGKDTPLSEGISATVESIFGDDSGFKFEGKKPEQVEAYRAALEKEKASIAVYEKMAAESGENQAMCAYLIKQEEDHYQILEEITKAVDRPNAWIESAEFGVREEY